MPGDGVAITVIATVADDRQRVEWEGLVDMIEALVNRRGYEPINALVVRYAASPGG